MSVSTSTAIQFDSSSQNRALALCLAASIALHAVVLFLVPGMRARAPETNEPKVLVARIAPRTAPPEPAPPAAEVVQPPPAPEPPKPPPERPRPEAKVEPQPRPALTRPTPAPEAPQFAPSPATAPAPAPSAPAEAAPAQPPAAPGKAAPRPAEPSAPAKGESVARPAPSAEEVGSLDQYRLAVIGAAKKYKRYPAQALEKGWQGRVEIRMIIGANGMIQAVNVKTSSGFEILDNQAVDMVKKAKPLAPIPAALRGKEFTVDIPVIFDLQTG